MLIGSAAVANVRRIQRYLDGKMEVEKAHNATPKTSESAQKKPGISIFVFVKTALLALRCLGKPQMLSLNW
jgi:hypothetical protein